MKTVAQWAEQLPELIRIEFLKECKKHELNLKRKRENLSGVFWLSFWWLESYTELGSEFWQFVRNELNDETNYYDYLDESVPYTKEEVEAMILEYADPNDEVCKVMLANVGKTKEATLANQLTYEALSLSNKNLIIEIGEITKENEALKREVEAGKEKIKKLAEEQFGEWNKQRKVIFKKNDEIIAKNERIAVLERELKATQEAVAPKKQQSIFFDLLEHLNIIKK